MIRSLAICAALTAFGAGCSSDQERQPKDSDTSESQEPKDYSFAMPNDLKDGETIYVTTNERVYECSKADTSGGSNRVQCKDSNGNQGLSLHRQK